MADQAFTGEGDTKTEVQVPQATEAAATANPSPTNKRKRDSLDDGQSRPAPGEARELEQQSFLPGHNTAATDEESHANPNAQLDFGALAQHNSSEQTMHQNGGPVNNPSDAATAAAALSHYSMTVPQPTEMSFQAQSSTGEGDRPMSASFGMGDHQHGGHGLNDFPNLDALKSPTRQANESNTGIHAKPAVGSEEWHKQRRDNHKEVERRRRETINEGINELAKIVPGCEKNKGSILQRAVQFITQLKENEQANIEKWTLEKLLTEQAITELSNSCEKLKSDCQRAWDEKEAYRRACEKHGIVPEEFQNQGENADKNGEN